MGFIQDTTTTSLRAYLTQIGRKYLVDGNKIDFQIKYFSFADPDVNYLQASEPFGDNYNTLPSGYVPDLAGKIDASLNGIAGGIAQNFSLKGGTSVAQIGTNGILGGDITSVGFASTSQSVLLNKRTTGYQLLSFDVSVALFAQSPIGVEGVRVFVLPPSQGTSSDLYHAISTDGIVQWDVNDMQQKSTTISINLNKPIGRYRGVIALKLVPYKSVLDTDYTTSVMEIDVNINITDPASNGGSSSSGSGNIFSLGFTNS